MQLSDIDLLFENFFGNKNEWGPIYKMYKRKYQTSYTPIGDCLFLCGPIVNGSHIPAGYDIVRKANLYKTTFDNNGLDILTPIFIWPC
jgi:hypothetical protein